MRDFFKHWIVIFAVFFSGVATVILVQKGWSFFSKSMAVASDATFSVQRHLERVYPLKVDQKLIAVVVMGEEDCEGKRTLDSIFDQVYSSFELIYVGNGISSCCFEAMTGYVNQCQKERQTTSIHYEESKPELEILYEVIHRCDPNDIIVLVRGGDWLAHEYVFDHLNRAYAHPDVWMTYSRSLNFPDYSDVKGAAHCDAAFNGKRFRSNRQLTLEGLKSFYAGFFQTIRLQDCVCRGSFIGDVTELAFLFPLLEMGPDHVLFLDEVAYISGKNHHQRTVRSYMRHKQQLEAYLRSLPVYPTTHHWESLKDPLHRYIGDVVVLSEDRPLQLYATLESLCHNVSDTGHIRVIYEASDPVFERAYLEIESVFSSVEFLAVCDYPTNTFHRLLSCVVSQKRTESPYVFLLDDRVVITEKIALHRCIQALEKTHADHFIIDCELAFVNDDLMPVAYSLEKQIVARQVETESTESLTGIALCRKSLFEGEKWQEARTFAAFKRLWRDTIAMHSIALFFCGAQVTTTIAGAVSSKEQQRQWAYRLIEGFKIDLPSLLCELEVIEEGAYPLIKRQRRRKVARRF
ncbi:MAG: hypothetical protein AAF443_00945 [Chlamydiota bacterium]